MMMDGFTILMFCMLQCLFPVSESIRTIEDPWEFPLFMYDLCKIPHVKCLVGWKSRDETCLTYQNCTTMIAVEPTGDIGNTADFYMVTKLSLDNKEYVAAGFSTDQTMGDDGVIECIYDEYHWETLTVFYSYTQGHDGVKRLRGGKHQKSLVKGPAYLRKYNGYLFCYYTLEMKLLDFEKVKVDLKGGDEYYLFGVAGNVLHAGTSREAIGKHTISTLISDQPYFKKKKSSGNSNSSYFSLISILLLLLKA